MTGDEILAVVFSVTTGAFHLLWIWRERSIHEMRRIHAEQLAAERRSWMGEVGRIAAERDVYRERYLGLMGKSVLDLEEWS